MCACTLKKPDFFYFRPFLQPILMFNTLAAAKVAHCILGMEAVSKL